MAIQDYSNARRLGLKAYRQDMSAGRHPYLKVLDELLPFAETAGETDLGLIEIPIEQIVGTKTSSRTKAFAGNFMPLLNESSEFAAKWSALYRSHLAEGIREPVIACEFMNSYYIIEGNKRVSVLKYSGAVTVPGYVTRIIPAYSEEKEIQIYYEFMDFSRFTGIHNLLFTKPGSYHKICRIVGKAFGEIWSDDERRRFTSGYYWFSTVFCDKGGLELPITAGDAFLRYLDVYGYEEIQSRTTGEMEMALENLWKELETMPYAGNVNHILQPEQEPDRNLLLKLITPSPSKLTVGFLYHETPKTSSWTYAHDLGRIYLEENMGDKLEIHTYENIETEEQCMASLEQAIADGCSVIFTTSARFLGPSLNICIRYPENKILNCSLNSYSGHLRTYYGRIYEAKFLVGMLAGILTTTDHIGYIADFPVFGAPASVNAFALGVKMVNPAAKVHLAWSCDVTCNISKQFTVAGVSHICGRDMIEPHDISRAFGLYDVHDVRKRNLAASIWNWGKFYQRILQTILNGHWNRTAVTQDFPTINYWWGISSGMIDIIASQNIPQQSRKLVDLMKKQIESGDFQIFSGDLYDQESNLRNQGDHILSPNEIMKMTWLADNVVGSLPKPENLNEEAAAMVRVQGFELL